MDEYLHTPTIKFDNTLRAPSELPLRHDGGVKTVIPLRRQHDRVYISGKTVEDRPLMIAETSAMVSIQKEWLKISTLPIPIVHKYGQHGRRVSEKITHVYEKPQLPSRIHKQKSPGEKKDAYDLIRKANNPWSEDERVRIIKTYLEIQKLLMQQNKIAIDIRPDGFSFAKRQENQYTVVCHDLMTVETTEKVNPHDRDVFGDTHKKVLYGQAIQLLAELFLDLPEHFFKEIMRNKRMIDIDPRDFNISMRLAPDDLIDLFGILHGHYHNSEPINVAEIQSLIVSVGEIIDSYRSMIMFQMHHHHEVPSDNKPW